MKKDLATGDKGEAIVIDILTKTNRIVVEKDATVETRSHHDLRAKIRMLPPKQTMADAVSYGPVWEFFTLEVKNDVYSAKSGNVALEVYNPRSNKLSGLSITKADIWVQIVNSEVWFANTRQLITFIGIQEPKRIVNKAGDGNADLWLYAADMILPSVFVRVDNVPPNELTDVILKLLKGGV